MSESKYKNLINLIAKYKGKPIDPASSDYKEIEAALNDISLVLSEKQAKQQAKALSVADIQARLKFDKESLTLQRDSIQEEGEYLRKRETIHDSSLRILRAKIDLLLESGDLSKQELKSLTDAVKSITKEKKLVNDERVMFAKGEQVTHRLIQLTTGIQTNYMGPKGVIGSMKGFGKGLKKNLKVSNVLATVFLKVLESFSMADKAAAGIYKATGQSYLKADIAVMQNDLAQIYGPQTGAILQETAVELMDTRKTFRFLDKKERMDTIQLVSQYKALGVSAAAVVDITKFAFNPLDKDLRGQKEILGLLYNTAKKTKRSPEQVFREAAQVLPIFARFGINYPNHFAAMSMAASRSNVDVMDLVQMTERFDTSENALKQTARFNALLGGNFLNPAALLSADPQEKVKLITEAYQRAQSQIGEIHPRIQRELSKTMGLKGDDFVSLMRTKMESFADDVKALHTGPEAIDAKLKAEILGNQTAGQKLQGILTKIGTGIFKLFSKVVPAIVNAVEGLFRFIKQTTIYKLLFGDEDKKKVSDPNALKAVQAEQINENQKKQLGSDEFELQNSVLDAMNAGETLTPEQAAHFTKMQDRIEGDNTPSGMKLPDPVGQQPQQSPYKGVTMDKLLNARDASASGFVKSEKKRKQVKDNKIRTRRHVTPKTGAYLHHDSPGVMTTTRQGSLLGATVPKVSAKYETSSEDTVLIGRLISLKNKINEYTEKRVKINLNVGLDTIAEVSV